MILATVNRGGVVGSRKLRNEEKQEVLEESIKSWRFAFDDAQGKRYALYSSTMHCGEDQFELNPRHDVSLAQLIGRMYHEQLRAS